jgi:hypothetical protein
MIKIINLKVSPRISIVRPLVGLSCELEDSFEFRMEAMILEFDF